MGYAIGGGLLALLMTNILAVAAGTLDLNVVSSVIAAWTANLALWQSLALVLVIAASGFVSGLSGFGFSAIGALSLWLLPPVKAIPLLMALSTANQMMSMHGLMSSFDASALRSRTGPIPYIVGGMLGVPAGLWILSSFDGALVCALTGTILMLYSCWSIFKPKHTPTMTQSPARSVIVGFVGGVIGGFTAFPGCAVVIWAGLVGMNKTEQRTTTQPFILSMQLFALATLAASSPQKFGTDFWYMFIPLMTVALPFTRLGVAAFHRLSDANFKQATHGMLSVSGAALLAKAGPLVLKLITKTQLHVLATAIAASVI